MPIILYLWRHKFTILYVSLIPIINWSFANTKFVTLPDGGLWSPFSILVGMILVVRDFAQREIGHYVFIPMFIGVALSFYLAPPIIAFASAAAFLVSETIDWAIYTHTDAPLSKRVLYSSLVGSIVDTGIYLYLAQFEVPSLFGKWTIGSVLASKWVGAIIVYFMLRRREQKALAA